MMALMLVLDRAFPWRPPGVFAWLLVLFCSVPSEALDPDRLIVQHSVQRWSVDDGLPMDATLSILLSERGYLWLSMQEGFARFDGVRFEHFDRSRLPDLPHNQVSALAEDASGALWVGSERGLLRFGPDGETRAFGVEREIAVRSLLVTRDGSVWAGSPRGLWRLGPGSGELEPVPISSVPESSGQFSVRALVEDGEGTIWVGTSVGLLRLADQRIWGREDGLPTVSVEALHLAREGSLWIGTSRGVARWRDGVIERSGVEGLDQLFVQALFEDSSGQLWIGTKNDGLARLSRGRLARWSTKTGPVQVRGLLEDRSGGLWVASGASGGLLRLSDGPAQAWRGASGLSSERVFSVLAEADGTVWVGTFGGGLNRLVDGEVEVFGPAEGLPSEMIWSLFRDRAGDLWIGTYGDGLVRMRDGRFETFRITAAPNAQFIRAIAEDGDGRLWVGTRRGLFRREERIGSRRPGAREASWRRFAVQDGLPSVSILSLHTGRDGRLIVTTEDGAALVDGDAFEVIEGSRGQRIYAAVEDGDGRLWLGTENGGLARVDDGALRFFGREQGLYDDLVYSVLPDGEGNVWMSSNRGLWAVSFDELDAVARGDLAAVTPRVLDRADGLPTLEMNGGSDSSASRGADGRLWFPSPRGAVSIDPRRRSTAAEPPAVILEAVRVDQERRPAHSGVVLEPGWRHMQIRWTAPAFTDAEDLRFRYRLDGHDGEWLDILGEQRVLNFSSLPFGSYRLRLEASFDGERWGPEMSPLNLRVVAPWWRMPWALVLVALIFVLLVVGVFAVQRRRLQHQRAVAAQERAIAARLRELAAAKDRFLANTSHELRTPLYGIVGLAEALLEERGDGDAGRRRHQLEQIASAGRRLGGLVGDILDMAQIREGRVGLDVGVVDVHRIFDTVTVLCEPQAERGGLTLRHEVDPELPPARADERRLLQILLNLVDNAIKFTAAGSVTLSAKIVEEKLRIAVSDTGIGIEPEKAETIFAPFEQGDASAERHFGGTGLGLAISQQLVEMHGSRLEVDSSVGRGSTFSFVLPAAAAHERPTSESPQVPRPRPVQALGDPRAAEATPRSERKEPSESESAHILVVDDEPILRMVLEEQLAAEGYRVTAVADGSAAVELVRRGEHEIDLIVLDVMMPGLSGLEVCRQVRQRLGVAELPILLLTAKDRLLDLAEGFAVGANDYLIKPVGREELVARLDLHLRILHAHRAKTQEIEKLRSLLAQPST